MEQAEGPRRNEGSGSRSGRPAPRMALEGRGEACPGMVGGMRNRRRYWGEKVFAKQRRGECFAGEAGAQACVPLLDRALLPGRKDIRGDGRLPSAGLARLDSPHGAQSSRRAFHAARAAREPQENRAAKLPRHSRIARLLFASRRPHRGANTCEHAITPSAAKERYRNI